jgi:rod shape determining protein RodA
VRSPFLKILAIAVFICILGILSIYSNTYQQEGKAWQAIYKRQIIWVLLGVAFSFAIYNLNYRRLIDLTYFLYGIALFLLGLVHMLGDVAMGAQRWLKVGGFNFQPSELTKLIVVIFLAKYFSNKSADDVSLRAEKFGMFRGLMLPFIFAAIPMGLIIKQPDLGSGMLVLFIFFIMLYLSRVKLRYILIFLSAMFVAMPLLWHFLRDYQKDRLLVFLNPNIDPLGAGYTVIQSKISIGSAGFWGKGWLSGPQNQLHFLPESHTDFIAATFIEEHGLFGGILLVLLYYLLVRQGIKIAERTSDDFGKLLACGISMMLCVQVFINIAMNMGLAPVVGIPLPLMSYGGSSVLVTFISLGILANIDKTRAVF